jgi:hypothetical protein
MFILGAALHLVCIPLDNRLPDTATAALGVLVAAGVLATVGRTRRPAPPQTHSPDRTVHLPL